MKSGDTARIKRDLAPSLIGARVKVIDVSLPRVTVQLLEDGKHPSCWKTGDVMIVQQHQLEGEL